MKRSLDSVLFITKAISDFSGEKLEEKRIQRLVYLIESVGEVPIGYKYDIYFFGPYSSKLSEDLIALIGQGNILLDDGKHIQVILSDTEEKLEIDLEEKEQESVFKIAKRFGKKSTKELELLSTTQFIAELLGEKRDIPSIEAGVRKLNKNKYDEESIHSALRELQLA
jgi:uncharacterized protein YwgA